MLLGDKHSSCCSCAKCVCGTKLPSTVTLDIQGRFGPSEHTADLVVASVKSSFGCGAKIRIINPGGCDTDKRPLVREDIEIVDGGSGYATLGRTQPTVTGRLGGNAAVETECGGYPALTLTIAEGDDGGRPFWYLDDVGGGYCAIAGSDVYFQLTFEEGTVICRRPRMERCGGEDGWDPVLITKGYFYLPDPANVIVADIDIELTVKPAGSGTGAVITAVVDDDPDSETFGQIVDVTVDNGGEDYLAWAWRFPCDCGNRTLVLPQSPDDYCLYRRCFCTDQPGPSLVTLSFTACHGSGATAHVSEPIGVPGIDDGPITKIKIDNGGANYALLGRVIPTVDGFESGGGTEATITTSLASTTGNCGHTVWKVSSISVIDGGYNYTNGGEMTLTTSDGLVEAAAVGKITTTSYAPALSIGERDGTTFSVAITSNGDTPQTWRVASVTSTGAKTGFTDDEQLEVLAGASDTTFTAADVRASVDPDTGLLDAVTVVDGGSYALAGVIQSVAVTNAGRYYKEDATKSALTTPVSVVITQAAPSAGTDAELEAVVDTDPASETFGQVVGVTITKAGTNYLGASTLTDNCYEVRYPGPPVDKVDTNPESETFGQTITYQPPPSVRVIRGSCDFIRYGDSETFVAKCDDFTFTIGPDDPCDEESRMKVTPGGTLQTYDPNNPCCGCCCVDGETQSTPPLGETKCVESEGVFFKNAACDDVGCQPCCIVTAVDDSQTFGATEAQCTEVGGVVLPIGKVGCLPCDCTIGCGYDLTECETVWPANLENLETPGMTFCGEGCGTPQQDGPVLVGEWQSTLYGFGGENEDFPFGEIIPGGVQPAKVMTFVRNGTAVDFSSHCLARFIVINGAMKYVFTNCASGDVEIHEMADYWSLHDAAGYGDSNPCAFALSDNAPTSNDACVITLACAP